MSGVKHTPGRWERTAAGWSIRTAERPHETATGMRLMIRTDIALIKPTGPWKSEREANARLIAAAPDLLEALAVLVTDCSQI